MSLPTFPETSSSFSRSDVINQILSSIAMEELSLSHILNAEGEKIQYALGTLEGAPPLETPATIDDLLRLNESIRETLDSVMQNQMFLKSKMQYALALETVEPCEKEFLSSYIEALANGQTIAAGECVAFDTESVDSVGENITINAEGTEFTITEPGLYHIEWNLNLGDLEDGQSAVVGIIENGEPASGSATSVPGNFTSGTLIEVDTVPFTISLCNFGNEITIENPLQWENTAASIRIVRFADGASE